MIFWDIPQYNKIAMKRSVAQKKKPHKSAQEAPLYLKNSAPEQFVVFVFKKLYSKLGYNDHIRTLVNT